MRGGRNESRQPWTCWAAVYEELMVKTKRGKQEGKEEGRAGRQEGRKKERKG